MLRESQLQWKRHRLGAWRVQPWLPAFPIHHLKLVAPGERQRNHDAYHVSLSSTLSRRAASSRQAIWDRIWAGGFGSVMA